VLKKPVKEGAVVYQHQILVNDFLWAFIEAKQMMIINQMKDIKMTAFKSVYLAGLERRKEPPGAPSGRLGLILINGSYGAGKYNLAKTLKRFGPTEVPC
jgi:uncharacterized membrane protein